MTELDYAIKHGGLSPKQLIRRISRREFGVTLLQSVAGAATGSVLSKPVFAAEDADFTIAIIPDPQFLAESCPNTQGEYYVDMMNWIVENRTMVFLSSPPSFVANIKAVVGVGDCVNLDGANEYANAQKAWEILDANRIAFTTPPGNHDYSGNKPASRSNLGEQFTTGFFSATHRSSVYGSGIALGDGDMAYWIGSFDSTGANTAVKFVISGIKMLVLAMDFFAGNAAWSWAYDLMHANSDCECYVTTHAWLTSNGMRYQRTDAFGPNMYSMADAPYSNSAQEAWSTLGVGGWANLLGIFSGHDLQNSEDAAKLGTDTPSWYWRRVPADSTTQCGQVVQQLFANAQQIDEACSSSVSRADGAGQVASVFLLTRRPKLKLLEGRMISTISGDWFGPRSESFPRGSAPNSDSYADFASSESLPRRTSWSASETLLFSVPFAGLVRRYRGCDHRG